MRKLGVDIGTQYASRGIDISADELLGQYDAIVLVIGMSNMDYRGRAIRGVYDAIDFVEATKTELTTEIPPGKRIAVIGAGNTAIDAATCSVRLGGECEDGLPKNERRNDRIRF